MTFVVNRNINVPNICTVGCAFCGFASGASPDAYEHSEEEFRRRVLDAVDFGATEICMQSGIHPDWTIEDYEKWLRVAKDTAPQLHLHAYSPMEIDHLAADLLLPEVFARLRAAGLGSLPGTAAEVLHDGVRQRISPNKLPVARWVEIVEAAHGAGLRSTVTVMFGHIEEPWELAEHARGALAAGTHRRFHRVRAALFIPFHTLLGRTHGIEEISREENLKHTAAFRLALGRTVPSPAGQLGQDGPGRRYRGAALGVNDLGGTLMEESISRMAGLYHGVMLEPGDLIAAAHAAGRPAAERDTSTGYGGATSCRWRRRRAQRPASQAARRDRLARVPIVPGHTPFTPVCTVFTARLPMLARLTGHGRPSPPRADRNGAGGRGGRFPGQRVLGRAAGGPSRAPLARGPGYGTLVMPDENGVRLPEGFRSRVVARGDAVGRQRLSLHIASDGMAAFPRDDGGFVLVSNSEAFEGGASALRFDRCGTSRTPTASSTAPPRTAPAAAPRGAPGCPARRWRRDCVECDPDGKREAVAHPAMGVFKHEAAAVDGAARWST